MAGSWKHMTTNGGKLRNNESFTNMIENLGDAYEAAEECFGMVQVLADQLEAFVSPPSLPTNSRERWTRQDWIAWAVENYHGGLRIGGVQRPR